MSIVRVISLSRQAQRRQAFALANAHLRFSFFDAVDGNALDLGAVRASGAFAEAVEASYTAHGYGAALSHRELWKQAAAGTAPMTIAEDDAVFRLDFNDRSDEVLAGLEPGWDLVLWGWNFDLPLLVLPMGEVSPVAMLFDQQRMRSTLADFQALRSPVQALGLARAFGLPAYTLSANGARRMLELCYPLRPLAVRVPVLGHSVANIGVDVAASAAYPQTLSFACFPPLAVTPNRRGDVQA